MRQRSCQQEIVKEYTESGAISLYSVQIAAQEEVWVWHREGENISLQIGFCTKLSILTQYARNWFSPLMSRLILNTFYEQVYYHVLFTARVYHVVS